MSMTFILNIKYKVETENTNFQWGCFSFSSSTFVEFSSFVLECI